MPTRSPARLVVALAVAAVLAVFLVYTAIAGGSTPTLTPSQLQAHSGKLAIVGIVVGPVRGDSHGANGLRFTLKDPTGASASRVRVVYRGTAPPPLFAVGRSVVVSGTYAAGRLAGNDIVTKCPSKYTTASPKA
ncbi:MAG TPA: cytochrome c maturation protein CcmE [Gaiellaceae bacterium]|nr:cytochrome c maturation protein CcmE [Gaiellaceae bacterium]